MKTISLTFDNFNFVVDAFQSAGANRIVSVVQDAILEESQAFNKRFHRGVFNLLVVRLLSFFKFLLTKNLSYER